MVYNSCKQAIIHLGYIPDWLTMKVEINNLRNTDPKKTQFLGQTILLIHPPKQTWNLKMDPWKGDSYWKPSFPGSMLIFGGVNVIGTGTGIHSKQKPPRHTAVQISDCNCGLMHSRSFCRVTYKACRASTCRRVKISKSETSVAPYIQTCTFPPAIAKIGHSHLENCIIYSIELICNYIMYIYISFPVSPQFTCQLKKRMNRTQDSNQDSQVYLAV